MAKNSVQDKSDHQLKEEEEEEEKALSLCDLPVTLINNKVQQHQSRTDPSLQEDNNFDSNSHGGSPFSKESAEMCSADEVFFQGQILPLRLPSSSKIDDGNNNIKQFIKFMPCESLSESMDHCSLSEFRSSNSSSRSSSLRSQNSSSSITSSTTTTTKTKSKPKIRNQFHTIPSSPKPQLRQSSTSLPRNSISSSQGRKSSSAWEFFRVGVFPAPEIGLHDIKTRNSSGNRTGFVSGKNSSSHSTTATTRDAKRRNYTNHALKQFVGKGGGIFSGCSCSVDTVARIDARKVGSGGVGIGNNSNDNKNKGSKNRESETHAAKEKVLGELINEKKKIVENREKQEQVKKTMVMSRRRFRTFQWLKELHATSNDSILEERALLSSSSSN
ncbi:hypothetical protein PIB30_033880 [Stylosanthes scabra]|uniref:Uncharacterized protein n=1 Tax=Stylosanthes scabra TaxID=79078 RepID=A0ABU6TCD4_9FABA|nr:hypothetical protein [Stylosanthes scabra]